MTEDPHSIKNFVWQCMTKLSRGFSALSRNGTSSDGLSDCTGPTTIAATTDLAQRTCSSIVTADRRMTTY